MFSAIGYHLYNFKNVKNTHGGVLLKSNECFFTFFKFYNTQSCKASQINNGSFPLSPPTRFSQLPEVIPCAPSRAKTLHKIKKLRHAKLSSSSFPANNYLFKFNNKNTRKKQEICKVNNKDNRTMSLASLWRLYC